MTPLATLILLLVIVLPIAWFISEFTAPRWLRLLLGTLTILLSFAIAFLVGSLDQFTSNALFGHATKDLINATVTELDAGHNEAVLQALKQLQSDYRPTYENRAQYDQLVRKTIQRMQHPPATQPTP